MILKIVIIGNSNIFVVDKEDGKKLLDSSVEEFNENYILQLYG